MPFTLEELLPDDQRLRTVQLHDSVPHAIGLMHQHGYAQDLMQIEGIESRMKEAIMALYAGDDAGLEAAIGAVTDRAADIRKKIPAAIRGYLEKTGLKPPIVGDEDAVAEAENVVIASIPGWSGVRNRSLK